MTELRKKGFTLIEVCLVMMVFGIGVSSLMALLGPSLRQGNQAVSDSVVTTFGDGVMNALAGKAAAMCAAGDWAIWKNRERFRREVVSDIEADTHGGEPLRVGQDVVIRDYLGIGSAGGNSRSGRITLKYRLEIEMVDRPETGPSKVRFGRRLYRAILYVTDNEYADVVNAGAVFSTYMFYYGVVPEPQETP